MIDPTKIKTVVRKTEFGTEVVSTLECHVRHYIGLPESHPDHQKAIEMAKAGAVPAIWEMFYGDLAYRARHLEHFAAAHIPPAYSVSLSEITKELDALLTCPRQ